VITKLQGCLLTAVLPLLVLNPVHAAGTAAGTVIPNTATLNYSIAGVAAAPITSAPATVTVDEIINLTLTWQDGTPVNVSSPDSNDPLRFQLVNTGNGNETYTLSRNNNPSTGDQYNPASSSTPIYLESNGTPGLQTGVGGDTPYGGSLALPPDGSATIYLLSDTPPGLPNGSRGDVQLTAASATPGASGAAYGTVLNGQGDGGVDAVVGVALGQAQATGSYLVSGLSVVVAKSVVSPSNPDALVPGVLITYRVLVTLSGTGTADNLVISDPLPAQVSYQPNSTTVSGNVACNPCTDSGDADPVAFSANTLTATLGTVAAPASFTLEFLATLN
jgi:uncharacterized repeat protein (TIGR01451 family)